jgi:hypothetical protein
MGKVCAILALLGWLIIPHSPRPRFDDGIPSWERLDLLGAATSISGLVLINFA